MARDPLDLAASPERLDALARAGVLDAGAAARAARLAVASPPAATWSRFLSTLLLGLGTLLVVAGVVYFFAWNWAALHRFAKLGILLGLVAVACFAAWRLGETLAGQLALLAAALLVGPLLGVYGQAYQTGADAWQLFAGWAALVVPWVALARFGPLWLLLLLLVDVTLLLHGVQTGSDVKASALAIAALGTGAWLVHEALARRGADWLRGRWLPRVLAILAFGPLVPIALLVVVDPGEAGAEGVAGLLLLAAVAAAAYAIHRRVVRDVFLLTLVALSAIALVSTAIGRLVFEALDLQTVGFLFLSLTVIAQVGLAAWWLRAEVRDSEDEA